MKLSEKSIITNDTTFFQNAIKPRLLPAFAGILVLMTGLAARYGLEGFLSKYLGVALWATDLYFFIVFIKPSIRAINTAFLALAIGWLIEFAQLTPVPAFLSSKHIILRLLFGTTFNIYDLPALAVGVSLAAGLHALSNRLIIVE